MVSLVDLTAVEVFLLIRSTGPAPTVFDGSEKSSRI